MNTTNLDAEPYVVAYRIKQLWQEYGYVPIFEERKFQELRIRRQDTFGRTYEDILDKEEVPQWALIDIGTVGSTSWRSKFKEYIK